LEGLLQPLPIPKQKWKIISMDFITGLPKVKGKGCIYFMVDKPKKISHLFDIHSQFSESKVVELFFREIL